MRSFLLLITVLLFASTGLASANIWNAPDSTRPALWGARASAPFIGPFWNMPAPILPEIPPSISSGDPFYTNTGYGNPWTGVNNYNSSDDNDSNSGNGYYYYDVIDNNVDTGGGGCGCSGGCGGVGTCGGTDAGASGSCGGADF